MPDPGGLATANRYAYVQGDPVNFNDPTGRLRAAPDFNCGPEWITDASLSAPCSGGNYTIYDDWGGGGGGSSFCGGSYFNPVPGPSCYAPVSVPISTPTSAPKKTDCFAQLKDRPVNDPKAAKVNAVHTSWWVQDSTGTQYII